MQQNRRVRLISKRNRRADESPAKPPTPESKEREIKTVVSRWVSEHRLRSEELRRTFTTILGVTAS
jgi:hypothetical protein